MSKTAMKSGRARMMNGRGQEVGIDLDAGVVEGVPPGAEYPAGGNPRSHSRSQSWSFNSRGQRPGAGELPSSLAALTPITSVIREIVPSFGGSETESSSAESPLLISRAASQASLPLLSSGIRFGDPGSPISTLPHRTGGGVGGGGGRVGEGERGGERGTAGGGGNEEQQQNIGFEISDGVRWLEHNAIFIILLLLKFACLIFKSPNFGIDLWNLLWSICVTDYIIRFGTMALKALVAGCFLIILPSRKKGKYYMLLEFISQFYRNLLPLPLWFRYLSNSHHTGAIFAIIITATYLMIKGGTYGTTPTKDEMMQSSNSCPICQEAFEQPVMLKCRHIFCEDCVLQWFDRQSTCPLCRATIASSPKWRDGSTAAWPSLF
ncbi:RING finger and transmembrane domain-containing protein 2 [Geodia barretti]|uniref:RING finger and transmembrane domain-containing protein 2 n=1 Tax=Geodia barretti TaxID=519541 RepID=A0AA35T819_GEOBA|nr:RING finger and transmembrane domain-containing protein 2 [Geodia barretti]